MDEPWHRTQSPPCTARERRGGLAAAKGPAVNCWSLRAGDGGGPGHTASLRPCPNVVASEQAYRICLPGAPLQIARLELAGEAAAHDLLRLSGHGLVKGVRCSEVAGTQRRIVPTATALFCVWRRASRTG
ncbi:hypothetical protein PsYK624_085820 [Phanerochaete sordida]|uniref:Uncharacterized protein n=1 Tax=Phanerochaete sordida TaxID=48140 RepID=A0A9P3LFA9_9APHY|nr:hypothetical protein PsYK624_085820 [Phanerochaete sordida]